MKKISFSKTIIAMLVASYFVVLGVGIYMIVTVIPEQLYALLTLGASPITIVAPFYMKKAEKENTQGGITFETAIRNIDSDGEGIG